MKKINKILLSLGLFFLILNGCTKKEENFQKSKNQPDKIHIVTSIYPVYEIVKEVIGDQAEVSLMVGTNEDAHHYEPTALAINQVNEADLFIYGNDLMEFWVEKLLKIVENDQLEIIELVQTDDLFEVEDDEHKSHDDHGGLDPHFWLDPVLVENKVSLIAEKLIEINPAGKEAYQKNSEKFSASLKVLDKKYKEELQDATNRTFVVQHQSFGHLAKRYELEQVAIGGLITEVEPDPKSLIEIVKFIRNQNVPIIYYQSGEKSTVASVIAKETKTEIAMLYDLENKPINIDADEHIYLKTMEYNLEQLKKSIQ